LADDLFARLLGEEFKGLEHGGFPLTEAITTAGTTPDVHDMTEDRTVFGIELPETGERSNVGHRGADYC
jgi:hypothetical protein